MATSGDRRWDEDGGSDSTLDDNLTTARPKQTATPGNSENFKKTCKVQGTEEVLPPPASTPVNPATHVPSQSSGLREVRKWCLQVRSVIISPWKFGPLPLCSKRPLRSSPSRRRSSRRRFPRNRRCYTARSAISSSCRATSPSWGRVGSSTHLVRMSCAHCLSLLTEAQPRQSSSWRWR
jgi:hypothetical protein